MSLPDSWTAHAMAQIARRQHREHVERDESALDLHSAISITEQDDQPLPPVAIDDADGVLEIPDRMRRKAPYIPGLGITSDHTPRYRLQRLLRLTPFPFTVLPE